MSKNLPIVTAEQMEERRAMRQAQKVEKLKMRDAARKQHLRLVTDTGYQYGWEVAPSADPRFWVLRCNQVVILENGDEPINYFASMMPRHIAFAHTNFAELYTGRRKEIEDRARKAGVDGKPTFYNVELTNAFEGEWKQRINNSMMRFFQHCKQHKARPTIKSAELLLALTGNKGVVPEKK